MIAEETRLLGTEEAARRLGLSMSLLEKWRLREEGPRYLKIGRAVRYRASDLNIWLATHVVKGGGA